MVKKDRSARVGEPVLMRVDSSSAVQWEMNCKGGMGEERSGGMLIIVGRCAVMVRARKPRVGGGERVSKRNDEVEGRLNPTEVYQSFPAVPWQAQELGWEKRGCVQIFSAQLRTCASREVDSEDLWASLENVRELEGHESNRNLNGKADW